MRIVIASTLVQRKLAAEMDVNSKSILRPLDNHLMFLQHELGKLKALRSPTSSVQEQRLKRQIEMVEDMLKFALRKSPAFYTVLDKYKKNYPMFVQSSQVESNNPMNIDKRKAA